MRTRLVSFTKQITLNEISKAIVSNKNIESIDLVDFVLNLLEEKNDVGATLAAAKAIFNCLDKQLQNQAYLFPAMVEADMLEIMKRISIILDK